MTDARNVYPRLCWGCLGVIEDYTHDHALLNHGGYCTDCHMAADGEMPLLRDALRGQSERMNDVSEREGLLREVSAFDKRNEGDTMSEELQQGIPIVGEPGPEIITLPPGAQVFPNAGEWVKVADLRRFIRKEVHAALDDIAREIRRNTAFQPVTTQKQAGTCCACLQAGDDMEWIGHRLAHRNEECRRIAAEMEPVREHRG